MFISNLRLALSLLTLTIVQIACTMVGPYPNSTAPTDRFAIAYLRFTEGYWQIWKTDREGRQHRQLTVDPIDKVKISWSGESRLLSAVRSDGRIILIDQVGATKLLNLPFDHVLDASLSPDGEWLSVSVSSTQAGDNNDLWIVATNSEERKKLTGKAGLSQMASWSADGMKLVFSSGSGRSGYQIWMYDVAKHTSEQVTTGDALRFEPIFSPSGSILYSEGESGDFNIVEIDQKGKYRKLTQHPALDAQPALSADGRYLLFYSQREQAKRIWLMSASNQEGKPMALTPVDVYSRQPIWLDRY